ncbi:hypothetical protein HHK36_001625 [Tetracentron sinense]|uniref:eIF-4F 25 kDa subunit n=1 Tax=Tetracentron sinense TaxID=13715 RepID=A0A834ZYF7_TETSI|nr:hypothetical protein HHK36_001625 [Tetracentron sinense]
MLMETWPKLEEVEGSPALVQGGDGTAMSLQEPPLAATELGGMRKGEEGLILATGELLALIGEQFDCGNEICGAVFSVRAKQDKLALWTKNASNEDAQMSIGRQWKEFLDYKGSIGFIFHVDAKQYDKLAKNRYVI